MIDSGFRASLVFLDFLPEIFPGPENENQADFFVTEKVSLFQNFFGPRIKKPRVTSRLLPPAGITRKTALSAVHHEVSHTRLTRS